MASEEAKPDGVFEVTPGEVEEFIASKPVRAMPGIGPKSMISIFVSSVSAGAEC